MRKVKHPLSRAEVLGIVKRFMKPDAYVSRRDIPLFYKVFTLYPDAPFWRAHQLPFSLNCIAWFLSADGRAHLDTAVALFHLEMPMSDIPVLLDEKTGDDMAAPRISRTVSDLFG